MEHRTNVAACPEFPLPHPFPPTPSLPPRYLSLMRRLQLTYGLEPAGSHGVWGLDDFHFVPFLLGAAQLEGHTHLRPKSIHSEDILEHFSKDYYYLACVKFIKEV